MQCTTIKFNLRDRSCFKPVLRFLYFTPDGSGAASNNHHEDLYAIGKKKQKVAKKKSTLFRVKMNKIIYAFFFSSQNLAVIPSSDFLSSLAF